MRLIPASLSGRLLAGALVLIVAALLATGIGMDLALRRFIQGQVDGRLDGQIASVEDALRLGPDGTLSLAHVVDGPPFDRPGSGWTWQVLAPGPVLRSQSLEPRGLDLPPLPAGRDWPPGPPDPTGRVHPATVDGDDLDKPLRIRAEPFSIDGRTMTIVAAAPLRALTGPLGEAMRPLATTLVLLAALLIGGAALQVRLGLRPLADLTAALTRVRTGRAARIVGTQPREIAPLVDELNRLFDQNAANLERARRHVANLAHGLKTPLATLALELDETGRNPRLGALVSLMDRRIRHHLARARLAALGGPERSRTLLAERVADHLDVFRKLYVDKGLAFTAAIGPETAVACEKQDLDEMVGNLLDNACKWARHAVAVEAVDAGEGWVGLAIEDDGPGLPESEAQMVLRPGLRLDESVPGHGFGLTITLELAELYGGALDLGRASIGGLRVLVRLPASPAGPDTTRSA